MTNFKYDQELTQRAENMNRRAYDMFPLKHEPLNHVENTFPMYSYERAASIFWEGFIQELMERGLSDEEVEELLRSKHMRWMFDAHEGKLAEFAKTMVTDELVTAAKNLKD